MIGVVLVVVVDNGIFNPFTATGYSDIPSPRWPTFLVTLFPILKEGMGLSLLDEFEVQYHVIKSNEFQTYDGAKVKVFARFESESAQRRHCLCSRPAPTRPLVEIFTGPSTTTGTRSNDGEGDDFFFYLRGSFKCMIVILPTF